MIRTKRNFSIAACILLPLFVCIPAVFAAGAGMTPLVTIPANDTSLADVAVQGTGVPLSALMTQDEITLLDLESNQTTFPGPRDMAFGPRSIRVMTNLPLLFILAAGACLGVLAVILYRRRKAVKKEAPGSEETVKTGPETGR